jgi:hypothetical protein
MGWTHFPSLIFKTRFAETVYRRKAQRNGFGGWTRQYAWGFLSRWGSRDARRARSPDWPRAGCADVLCGGGEARTASPKIVKPFFDHLAQKFAVAVKRMEPIGTEMARARVHG